MSSHVVLGTQISADYPQMLAYARSPPNCGGLTADGEKRISVWIPVTNPQPFSRGGLSPEPGGRGSLVRMLFADVVTYVRRCHQNRKSTQIHANREPIHPRLAPLKPHALWTCSNFEPGALVNRGARAARWEREGGFRCGCSPCCAARTVRLLRSIVESAAVL